MASSEQLYQRRLKLAFGVTAFMMLLCHPLLSLASPEFDRRYSLQSVGALKSSDNVDGLFSNYVADALKDYFSGQPRFTMQDLTTAQSLIDKSKLPYDQVIEDSKVLEKLARATRSETLIRTKIFKEGPRYRFTIDWLHAPKMDALSSEVFYLDEPRDGNTLGAETIRAQIQIAMDRLIRKVPFYAQINGRDGDTVTINSGENLGLKKGDTLWVGTIDDVKKHPLLNVIAEWKIARTGSLRVEQVDHALAFCKIVEEDPARPIARGQKITQITAAPPPAPTVIQENESEKPSLMDREEPPRLGWVSAAPQVGTFTRQFSSQSGSTGKTGGGTTYGGRTEAVVWLDREWFTEGALGFSAFSFSQSDIVNGSSTTLSGSGTLMEAKIALGYSYLPGLNFFGAKGWIKAGYQTAIYSLPKYSAQNVNPVTWSGMLLGIGGDLPLRSGWTAQLNLDFGLLRSVKETGTARAAPISSTMVHFYFGTVYNLRPRLLLRTGVAFQSQGAEYDGGASLSHRTIALIPSFVIPF
ncbi:hypothetical protein EBZ37_08360 [bacterium]|nr:hypothetical protein [bacterium]